MGLHLYCIVPAGHGVAPLAGIEGRPVRSLEGAGLGVWTSEHPTRPRPAIETVRAHNAVVEAAITDQVTPVPVRFGQWLDSEAAATAAVAEGADHYATLLEEFAGAVEFGVRILEPELERSPRQRPREVPSGRQYMAALAERSRTDRVLRRRGEEVAARLEAALGPIVRRARTDPLESNHGLVSTAYLVGRHDFGRFHARMRTFRAQSPELRFLTSGPWPPYSFVE